MKKFIYTIILLVAFQFAQGQVPVISIVSFDPQTGDTATLAGSTVFIPPGNADFNIIVAVMFLNDGLQPINAGDTVWIEVVFNEDEDDDDDELLKKAHYMEAAMSKTIDVGGVEGIWYPIPVVRSEIRVGTNQFCARVYLVSYSGELAAILNNPYCMTFTLAEKSSIVGVDSKEVNIYPNPVCDHLKIENLGNATDINIYSTTGQVVRTVSSAMESVEIDMTNLSAGIYFVKMQDKKNTITKKIQIVK